MFWRRPKAPDLYLLTDDLAIGPQPEDRDLEALRELGFRGIVDLRHETAGAGAKVRALGLNYMRAPIVEGAAPSIDELYEVTGWVTGHILNEGPVFVHCREGRGRSAMVAVASLVKLGLPLPEAYSMLTRTRPTAVISTSQMQMLEAFAKSLDATTAA
jgi:protein-tyrosine phosphatase